jgi:hypothetical protein
MRFSPAFQASSAAALLLAATAGAALAATPSGTAVAVIQATSIVGSTGQHVLEPEAPIFMGDRVNTDTIGEAQIKFRDNTRLVVGPNSSLLIDKFVFSDETTARSVTINAVRGTFRFITGSSPSNAYLIRTPTATIGLRGTQFDFAIGARGETRLALYGGGVRFCDLQQRCVELTGRCDVVVAAPGEGIRRVQSDGEKAGVIAASFPYLRSQWGLNSDFRVDTASCAATQVNYAGLMPVSTPPAPDCPPAKDYGHGKHGKGEWGGHRGKGKGKGGWSGRSGQHGKNNGYARGGERGGKGDSHKGFGGKGQGKGGDGRGPGGKGNGGHGFGGTNGDSALGLGNTGWSGGKGGNRGAGGRGGR